MTVTLTWDGDFDFSEGPNVIGNSLDISENASNAGKAEFWVDIEHSGGFGTDAEASVNNFSGDKISYSAKPDKDTRTKLGTLSLNGGNTVRIVADAQSDRYKSVSVEGPNGLDGTADSNDDYFQQDVDVKVHYSDGTLTGETKSFGDGLFRVTEVTVEGQVTSNTDMTTYIYDDSGNSESYSSTGTFSDTANLSPTSSLSINVNLESSDGFESPTIDSVTVKAESLVLLQVYQNGSWTYKSTNVLTSAANENEVTDIAVYQNGEWK